jgi:O-antigen/teichoic acid export membrane protein
MAAKAASLIARMHAYLERVGAIAGIDASLLFHSSFLLAATMLGQGLSFLVQILVARKIGVESYGIYSYAFSCVSVLALVATLGGDRVLVRFVPQYRTEARPDLQRLVLRWTGVRSLWLTGLASIGLLVTARFVAPGGGEWWGAMAWASLALVLMVAGNLAEGAFRAYDAHAWANLPSRVLRPVAMGAAFLLLDQLAGRSDGRTAVEANVIAIAISVGLAAWALRSLVPRKGPGGSLPANSTWHRASIAFGLSTLAIYLSNSVDLLLLGPLADEAQVGIYAAVARLVTLLAFANVAVIAIIQPMLSKEGDTADVAALQGLVSGGARFAFLTNLFLALPMLVWAEPLLSVFGEGFAAGSAPLRILLIGNLLASLVSLAGPTLSMRGFERDATNVLVAGCFVAVAANAVAIYYFGMIGAALATSLSTVAWNIGLFATAWRRTGILALPVRRFFPARQPMRTPWRIRQ